MDQLKLAKAMCKSEVDAEHQDSPDVIWGQMRESVRQAYLNRAAEVIRFMEMQR